MNLQKQEVETPSRQRDGNTGHHGALADLGVFTVTSLDAPPTLRSARQGLNELLLVAETGRMTCVLISGASWSLGVMFVENPELVQDKLSPLHPGPFSPRMMGKQLPLEGDKVQF